MQLANGVHGLSVEVSLEDQSMTLHPTAVETPRGLLLLDVGLPDCVPALVDALEEEGLSLDDAWGVIVTHQDLDHAGCLAAVVERTGAVVFAHEADAPYLEGERDLVKSSDDDPVDFDPVTVDVRLVGGETFATDAGPMRAVYTPGHAPGHTSYYFPEDALLVSGDALNVVEGELIGPREAVTPDPETAWESVETLADLEIAATFCYHGGHVAAGTDRIEELAAEH
ncbi:MAG: MBL fold metallo-hydrolase [Haloarculaceae archaeon]